MLHCGLSELGGCDGNPHPCKAKVFTVWYYKEKHIDTILDPIIGSISFLNKAGDNLLSLKQQTVPG